MEKLITSNQNKIYKHLLGLLETKGINEFKEALMFGSKVIPEISKNYGSSLIQLIEMSKKGQAVLPESLELAPALFKTLDIFGTDEPIAWVRIPEISVMGDNYKPSGCEPILPLQDPSNVGALIRTAAAFGINRILLDEGCAHPFHPKSSRAASGVNLSMEYLKVSPDFHLHPKAPVVGLGLGGESIYDFQWPENFFFIIGQEGQGLPKKYSLDHKVSIPIHKNVESLNATVAAALGFFSWSTKKNK